MITGLNRYEPDKVRQALEATGAEIIDTVLDRAMLVACTDGQVAEIRLRFPLLAVSPERFV